MFGRALGSKWVGIQKEVLDTIATIIVIQTPRTILSASVERMHAMQKIGERAKIS